MTSNGLEDSYVIGVDTGGTFTDIVVIDHTGKVFHEKAPSTPPNFSKGILQAIAQAGELLGIGEAELLGKTRVFSHGMTVATNAIINRKGAVTGLITTKGFEDTLIIMKARGKCLGLSEMEIKHQSRCQKPSPYIEKAFIKGVTERIDSLGRVVVPLNHDDVEAALEELLEGLHVESIGICTLWSIANPRHEEAIEAAIRRKNPEMFVSRSCGLVPQLGEYERTTTTAFNAYLMPETQRYLVSLEEQLKNRGLRSSPMIMKADGGVVPIGLVKEFPVFTIGSGPAGGVTGSGMLGEILGCQNIITADVGGTSFDVGLIVNGEPLRKDDAVIDQYALRLPSIDVNSIGAGGGSVIWYDELSGTLKVGPQSMGAHPGPACYDQGGSLPTLTDADLILGVLNPEAFLGGRKRLNRDRAVEALSPVASMLGFDVYEAALGARRVACSIMADLIQNQVVFRGYDPRDFVMFVYGGGGPEYGALYAKASGVSEMIMLLQSPVLSALGIATADILYSEIISKVYRLPEDPDLITRAFESLEAKVLDVLMKSGFAQKDIFLRREGQLRYGRQVNYVSVPVKAGKLCEEDILTIMKNFEARYESLYGKGSGYKRAGIELANLKVYGTIKTIHPGFQAVEEGGTDPGRAYVGTRRAYVENISSEVPVYDWMKLQPGNVIAGPAIIDSPFTTGVLLTEMEGRVDSFVNIHVTLGPAKV